MNEKKEPSAEEFYTKMHDDIYRGLLSNHFTGAAADFIATLAVRVEKLERNDI